MRHRRWLVFIVVLVGPESRVFAQHGPIAAAVARVASEQRLVPAPLPMAVLAATRSTSEEDGWRALQHVEPGSHVAVATSTWAGERYALHADDQFIVVLNLTTVDLSDAAKRELIDAATRHPDRLLATDRIWYAQEHVRVGPDGVFVDERRISDRAAVVERIDRRDVREVKRPQRGPGRSAGWGGVGATIGFFGGVGLAFDPSRDSAGRAYIGGMIGAAIGAITGTLAAGRPEQILYRAAAP